MPLPWARDLSTADRVTDFLSVYVGGTIVTDCLSVALQNRDDHRLLQVLHLELQGVN